MGGEPEAARIFVCRKSDTANQHLHSLPAYSGSVQLVMSTVAITQDRATVLSLERAVNSTGCWLPARADGNLCQGGAYLQDSGSGEPALGNPEASTLLGKERKKNEGVSDRLYLSFAAIFTPT